MTQTGDTTAGDAEMGEPTTTALTVGPGHGVSQWALCCLDHDKRWLVVQFESCGTNHLLERSLLAVSERKNVIHHSLHSEREEAWGGRETDTGGEWQWRPQKHCVENSASRAPLETQVEPVWSPEATKLRASCPHAPVLF